MKRKITYLKICFVTIVLSILVLESGLRLTGSFPESPFDTFRLQVCGEILGEYDEKLFWRLKGVIPDFKDSQTRIICLTDSVSVMYEGKGYPDLLEPDLARRLPHLGAKVFNGGVPGYTSFQGLKYFTTELIAYRPDIVIVCYGWNDHWQSSNGLPDKMQKPLKSSIMVKLSDLRIIRWLYATVMRKKQKHYRAVGPPHSMRVPIADYEYNIRKFVDICKKEGIKLILMTAPYLDGEYDFVNVHIKYNAVVRRIAAEKDIPLVDLVEQFKGRKDLFIDPDNDPVHYNWAGSKIVQDQLSKKIVEVY